MSPIFGTQCISGCGSKCELNLPLQNLHEVYQFFHRQSDHGSLSSTTLANSRGRLFSYYNVNKIHKTYLKRFLSCDTAAAELFNPLMGTLKPHSNGSLCSNTVIRSLAVDWWAVTLGTVRSGPAQSPPHCTKRNSPPINGQCTNHRIAA